MSSSDSDAPVNTRKNVPSDKAITSALRAEVQNCYANDDEDNLTLKRIRAAVAKKLKLADDFFKNSDKWNGKSKEIVMEEVDKHVNAQEDVEAEEDVQKRPVKSSSVKSKPERKAKPKSKPARQNESEEEDDDGVTEKQEESVSEQESPPPAKLQKPTRKPAQKMEQKKPAKRKSEEAIPQARKKRQKQAASSDVEEDLEEPNDEEREAETAKRDADLDEKEEVVERKTEDDEEDEEKQHVSKETQPTPQQINKVPAPAEDSDSEMSIVFDEPPPKKGGRKKSTSTTTSSKTKKPTAKDSSSTTTKSKATTKPESTLTPQEEEIKRLQSWLVKCGIRKVWSKELSNCDSSKEKVTHLKRLLKDVGMEGRFSEDKAKRIKEEREFKKDLEEIKEGNAKWGESEGSDGEDGGGGRPRRKLARGLKELAAFDDGEESD